MLVNGPSAKETETPRTSSLAEPFTLPCGAAVPNRLAKAAMTEQLATKRTNRVTDGLIRLYERWGRGGTGVLLTGNVMVDRRTLEGPRNVAVEDESDLDKLTEWAERAQANGSHLWMQISHAGRQTPVGVSKRVVAPSAIKVGGQAGKLMAKPRALEPDEIRDVIQRFATTAAVAQKAGFKGVQIHSAHGYLLSSFLNPLSNRRTDEWGGSLENRMRCLLAVYREMRERTGSDYPISVKLNSADFLRGGFSEEESLTVVQTLESEGVDLIEISGGNYENPMMMQSGEAKSTQRDSTRKREAFYLEYAERIRSQTGVPLMLTGGFRSVSTMAEVIRDGNVDLIGLARPLAIDPDFSAKAMAGTIERAQFVPLDTGFRLVDDMLQSMWHQAQMWRMARGLEPSVKVSRAYALAAGIYNAFGP